MSRKVMIEVNDNDIDNFIERGIVRAEVARNAILITESNDCVSRQAVLDVIEKEVYKWDALDAIKALPSVTPKCNPDKNVKTYYFHEGYCPKESEDKE